MKNSDGTKVIPSGVAARHRRINVDVFYILHFLYIFINPPSFVAVFNDNADSHIAGWQGTVKGSDPFD